MASTMVTVFPVPGLETNVSERLYGFDGQGPYGPKIMKGASPAGRCKMQLMACICGRLFAINGLSQSTEALDTIDAGRAPI